MKPVYIAGIGQTPVGEQWERSLRHIAHDAIIPAMRDAAIERADALYVGNMLSGELVGQEHLGALVADFVGLRGIEAYKVEAACGSGGAALRTGFMAVAGGLHDVVIVAGVEKMTDTSWPRDHGRPWPWLPTRSTRPPRACPSWRSTRC